MSPDEWQYYTNTFGFVILHEIFRLLHADIYSQKDKILINKSESTGSTFVHLQKLDIEWNIGDIDIAVNALSTSAQFPLNPSIIQNSVA